MLVQFIERRISKNRIEISLKGGLLCFEGSLKDTKEVFTFSLYNTPKHAKNFKLSFRDLIYADNRAIQNRSWDKKLNFLKLYLSA